MKGYWLGGGRGGGEKKGCYRRYEYAGLIEGPAAEDAAAEAAAVAAEAAAAAAAAADAHAAAAARGRGVEKDLVRAKQDEEDKRVTN